MSFRAMPKVFIQFQQQARKYRATNDKMFAAYVQMATDYPATIEKYL